MNLVSVSCLLTNAGGAFRINGGRDIRREGEKKVHTSLLLSGFVRQCQMPRDKRHHNGLSSYLMDTPNLVETAQMKPGRHVSVCLPLEVNGEGGDLLRRLPSPP